MEKQYEEAVNLNALLCYQDTRCWSLCFGRMHALWFLLSDPCIGELRKCRSVGPAYDNCFECLVNLVFIID